MTDDVEEIEEGAPSGSGAATALLTGRPLRADAAKNRRLLLAAAEDVFATDGVQAQVDLIAQRAGIGVGTFYRHFPTKEALIEAIVRSRLEALSDRAVEFINADDAGAALVAFLHDFGHEAASKRDLIQSLGEAGADIKTSCADAFDALKRGVEALLKRAQAQGSIREDVSTEDVIGLIAGTCQAVTMPIRDAEWIDRMVDIVCAGLRKQ